MKKRLLLALLALSPFVLSYTAFAATYVSANSGAWTTASNWSPNGVPGVNDDVFIDHNMTRAGGNIKGAGSITIRNNGRLTVSSAFTVEGNNAANGFEIEVKDNGNLTVTGLLTIDDHTTVTMTAGTGSVTSLSVDGGSYVANGGTMTATTNGLSITSSGGSSFSNNSGATFIVNTGASVGDVSAAKFSNGGTFRVINTGGDFTFANSGGTFSNTGTIEVGGEFTANATITNAGTLTANRFTVQNSGGSFTNTGIVTVTGVTNINGATVQLSPGASGDSRMTVRGVVNMQGWGNFNVGNGPVGSPARYADLVIEASLGQSAGSITVQCNGRVAIFSDFSISNGNFTIQSCGAGNGGQVYVDGDGAGSSVNKTGGSITNNNGTVSGGVPYGFYVNGTSSGSGVPNAGTVAQMQTTNPAFYAWVSSLPNSPLPVKLSYFKVTAVNQLGIALEWVTSMEKNFSHFELQRAGTDLKFKTVSVLQGRGGLQVKTVYQYLDQSPGNGKNYYRLKAVDLDNSVEYFQVIVADWSSDVNGITLYPNPAIDHSFTLDLGDEFDQSVNITVYEPKGNSIYSTALTAKTNKVTLPENIEAGVYFVKVVSQSNQQVVRLIVK